MMNRASYHYEHIVNELLEACQRFDDGYEYKAFYMSSLITMLLHDGGKRQKKASLASQLGFKDDILLPDTKLCGGFAEMGAPMLSLLCEKKATSVRFAPALEEVSNAPRVPYNDWRSGKVAKGVTRDRLLRVMRNQDGGAHVDHRVRYTFYSQLCQNHMPTVDIFDTTMGKRVSAFGTSFHLVERTPMGNEVPFDLSGPKTIRGAELALTRQIAEEVLLGLDECRCSKKQIAS